MKEKMNKIQKEFLEEFKVFLIFRMKRYIPIQEIEDFQEILRFEQKIKKASTIKELYEIYHQIYNFGIRTILNVYVLFLFYSFLSQVNYRGGLRGLSEEQVISFLFEMSQTRKTATLQKYLTHIRGFFDFLDKKRGFDFDFFLKNLAFMERGEKLLPKHLEKSELLAFIKTLFDYNPTNSYEKRNKCILLLITLGGLRKSEAIDLKLKNLKLEGENYSISIFGKGRRERKIYIQKRFLDQPLRDWLQDENRIRFFMGDYLFKKAFKKGRQKSCSLIRMVKKIYQTARIKNLQEYGLGLHIFRHSFATLLYSETQDLILTSRTLGHQTIETTKIYIHTGEKQNKQATEIFNRYL